MTKQQARRWLEKRGYSVTTQEDYQKGYYSAYKYDSPVLVGTLNELVKLIKQRERHE